MMSVDRVGTWLVIALASAPLAELVPWRPVQWGVPLLTLIVAPVRIGGLSAVDRLHSLVGPLSAASLTFAVLGLAIAFAPAWTVAESAGLTALAAIVLLVAVPFYCGELLSGGFDAYRYGFASPLVAVICLLVLAVGWWLASPAVAIWLGAAAALFMAQAYSSRNLVDYLIDPVAVIVAVIVLVRAWLAALGASAGPA